VAVVRTDVLEECVVSIIRVTGMSKLGTTLAVAGYCCEQFGCSYMYNYKITWLSLLIFNYGQGSGERTHMKEPLK
jgi:hypothetical protein